MLLSPRKLLSRMSLILGSKGNNNKSEEDKKGKGKLRRADGRAAEDVSAAGAAGGRKERTRPPLIEGRAEQAK